MTFNCIVPKHISAFGESDSIGSIIQSQQVVLQVFMMSAMPTRLVDTLMAEASGKSERDGKTKGSLPSEKNTAANTFCDAIAVSVEKIGSEVIRASFIGKAGFYFNIVWFSPVQLFARKMLSCRAQSPPGVQLSMIIFLLFFHFARSNVGDAGAVLRLGHSYTQLVK